VVGVGLLQRDDLATAKARVRAEQHEHQHLGSRLARAIDELVEICEVEELDLRRLCLQLREPRRRLNHTPLRRAREYAREDAERVVDCLRVELLHRGLEPLFGLLVDLVQPEPPQRRADVEREPRLVARGRARLEPVRLDVIRDEPLLELFQRRHLLVLLRAVEGEEAFALLTPALRDLD